MPRRRSYPPVTHGLQYAYYKLKCRCDECRAGQAARRRRHRAARRAHVVPCVICDEWFPTERGRNVHETRVHGL